MIFLTVGSQMPFDRLVEAMDRWAIRHPDVPVFAQIGDSAYRPAGMRWKELISPDEYSDAMLQSELIVAHAGMGTVISAATYRKPLIVMPRRGDLRETRNDHQVSTCRWLKLRPGIRVAMDEAELEAVLEERLSIEVPIGLDGDTGQALIRTVRAFVEAN